MVARLHASRLGGTAAVPSSKSMAHRAVLCAALSDGVSRLSNIEYSEDFDYKNDTAAAIPQIKASDER